jgi:7,8-dihydro-6-hydroxymethylpterin dimethyltransferase
MARPFPVAVRAQTAQPGQSLESRLEVLARPLRKLSSEEVAREFALPDGAALLKTTLSLCPVCLAHVTAAVYVESSRERS